MRKLIPIIVFALFASACSDGKKSVEQALVDVENARELLIKQVEALALERDNALDTVDSLNERIVALQTPLEATMTPNNPPPTMTNTVVETETSVTEPTEETTTTTVASAYVPSPDYDRLHELEAELAAMPVEECLEIDHFQFLELGTEEWGYERIKEDGSFFYFDCGNTMYDWDWDNQNWGWYFEPAEGRQAHAWNLQLPDMGGMVFPDEYYSIHHLPMGAEVPSDLVHPMFPDALTLGSVKVGDTVCRISSYGSETEYVVEGLMLLAELTNDPDDTLFELVMHVINHEAGYDYNVYLQSSGLIPFQNGLWSGDHFVAGACP